MSSAKHFVHIFVKGRVQGVFFRRFVQTEARKLGVVGFTQNLPDGRVEIFASHEEKQILDRLVSLCRRGPPMAQVHQLEVEFSISSLTEDYTTFMILD